MVKLEFIPNGINEINEYYGISGKVEHSKFISDSEWRKQNLKMFHLSFTLKESWTQNEIEAFIAHKKVGDAMVDALEAIRNYYGLEIIRKYKLDQFGGIYNPRFNVRSGLVSTHAWAIAIDYVPNYGPLNEPSHVPYEIVEAFRERGFFNNIKFDGMHNQACRGI